MIRAYRFLRDQADTKCPKLGVTKCHVMYVAGAQKEGVGM